VIALYRRLGGRLSPDFGAKSVEAALVTLTALATGTRRQQVLGVWRAFEDAGVPACDVPHLTASVIAKGEGRRLLWAVLGAHRIILDGRADEVERRPDASPRGVSN
jgi:hypothetical protein